MRYILICLFVFGLMPVIVQGQCTADAGKDTIVCVNGADTIRIGGNPTASGGVTPYTYIWETSTIMGPDTLTASSFLNDTSIANPIITNVNPEMITFYLTVIDSSGSICTGTIEIKFSRYIFTLFDYSAYINQGDTVTLTPNAGGGIPPFTFQWTPTYNLSDSGIANPLAYPDTTTFYTVTITDSASCMVVVPDVYEVYVTPVGINDLPYNELDITIYPIPSTGQLTLEIDLQEQTQLTIRFYNGTGQLIGIEEIKNVSGHYSEIIDLKEYIKGMYFVQISTDNSILTRKVVLY